MHAEGGLQRRVLVEVVQHDVGVGVALQGDDEPRDPAGRVVLHVADPGEVARLDGVRDLHLDTGHRGLIGDLRDDDLVRPRARLCDLGHGAHLHRAPARPVGVDQAGSPEDEGSCGKVGALYEAHELVGGGLGVLEEVQRRLDDLAEVVGRDVRRHADGDALGTVHQQVREPGRQDDGLNLVAVVVGNEVDGALVDPVEQGERKRGQPALRVPHGGRPGIGSRSAEVAVPVDERVPQAEILGHAGEGVVDRHVAVRMEAAHDIAHHLGALGVRTIRPEPGVGHPVEDATVHRLQAVPHVGKRSRHDDGHRVLEEGALHLLLDLDRLDRSDHRSVVVAITRCTRVVAVASCHEPNCLRYSPFGMCARRVFPPGSAENQMSRKRTSFAWVWI